MNRPGQVMVPLTVMLALLYVQLAPDVEVEADSNGHASVSSSVERTIDDMRAPVPIHSPALLSIVDTMLVDGWAEGFAAPPPFESQFVAEFLRSNPGRAPPPV